jgi:hypothetical protein
MAIYPPQNGDRELNDQPEPLTDAETVRTANAAAEDSPAVFRDCGIYI